MTCTISIQYYILYQYIDDYNISTVRSIDDYTNWLYYNNSAVDILDYVSIGIQSVYYNTVSIIEYTISLLIILLL